MSAVSRSENRKELKEYLRKELEEGTFFLHPEEIRVKLAAFFEGRQGAAAEDPELDGIAFQLVAGLAVYQPGNFSGELAARLKLPDVSAETKIKSLQVVRQHLLDPERMMTCLSLYGIFLRSSDSSVRDFSARSLLQTLTEMRVGGLLEAVLSEDEPRSQVAAVLRELSGQGWLEAGELLDLLELQE